MARYRAKAELYTERLLAVGEEFVSDEVPGRNWEPLDADARKAFEARFPSGPPVDKKPAGTGHAMMAIPDGWRDLTSPQIIQLAIKLGAPRKGTNRELAEQHIQREIAMRAHTSGERTREAA